MITEEQIIERAFFLFAPDDAVWGSCRARRDNLLALLQSYAAQERAAERERAVEAFVSVANDLGCESEQFYAAVLAAIRAEIPPPTQE